MRALLFGVAGVLATSACTQATAPLKSLSFVGGDITAAAPAGYCLDPTISRPRDGFAVLAPCISLGGSDSPPDVVAVATLQVGPADSGIVAGAEQDLVDLLMSDAGAALLSPTGAGDAITVTTAQIGEDMVTVAFVDAGAALIPGTDQSEYRAFTDIGGRLVTVGVRGLESLPLDAGTGSWLLNLIVTGLVPMTDAANSETSSS